jgi:hypothetical protein
MESARTRNDTDVAEGHCSRQKKSRGITELATRSSSATGVQTLNGIRPLLQNHEVQLEQDDRALKVENVLMLWPRTHLFLVWCVIARSQLANRKEAGVKCIVIPRRNTCGLFVKR